MSITPKLSDSELQSLNQCFSLASPKQKKVLLSILSKEYISKSQIRFIRSFLRQCKKKLNTQHTYTDTHLKKVSNNIYNTSTLDTGKEFNVKSNSKSGKTLYIDSKGNKRYI